MQFVSTTMRLVRCNHNSRFTRLLLSVIPGCDVVVAACVVVTWVEVEGGGDVINAVVEFVVKYDVMLSNGNDMPCDGDVILCNDDILCDSAAVNNVAVVSLYLVGCML